MGLVVIVLVAPAGGYDLLANPVGWVLVLLGTSHAPLADHHRGPLRWVGGLALVSSAVVWFPAVADALTDTDDSLAWAAELPQVAFAALLCRALADLAAGAGDTRSAGWLRTAGVLAVVAGVLPVVVLGGGVTSLADVAALVARLAPLLLVVLLLSRAGRPWAVVPLPERLTRPPAAP